MHVTVAAGNEGSDARYDSPAREPSAITVGSMNILDSRDYFSNFGPGVDIFAPGSNIISAWIGSPTTTKVDTGTSMVCSLLQLPGISSLFTSWCRLGNAPCCRPYCLFDWTSWQHEPEQHGESSSERQPTKCLGWYQ